jgi:hypothetical protein
MYPKAHIVANTQEQTGPVEVADNLSYAFSFCRRRVA